MRRHCPLSALVVAALAAACAREAPRPAVHRRADIELKAETVIVEARVPHAATLDSLLRQEQLSTDIVQAAIEAARGVFNPRQLRSDRRYRLVRTLDGLLREFEYQIDADRFLRIISRTRERPALLFAEVLPYEKQTEVVAVRGRIDDDHSSVIAAIR